MKWVWRIALGLVVVFAAAFLLLREPDTDPAEMRAKYGGAPSQFVELPSGATVHLRDEGPRDAPAILLLHGSNDDLHTWDAWAQALKDDHRVVRFDQIGHGLTGPAPDGDYSQAAFVKTIAEVADAVGLDRFTVGGNSMGGGHALAFAIAHPERVDGLVLEDAAGAPEESWGDRRDGGNIGFKLARMPVVNRLMEHITPRRLVAQSFEQSVSNKGVIDDALVDRYWEMLRYPGNRAATVARFSQPRESASREAVASLQVPVLLIWGRKDRLIPASAGEWFDRTLPDSRLVIYDDVGHLPHLEVATRSAGEVRRWLDGKGRGNPASTTME